MKKGIKIHKIGIIITSALLCVLIILLLFFLFAAPGSLTHPWLIPKADKQDVGQTVTLSFPELLQSKQYKNSMTTDDPSENLVFIYVCNQETQTGRLGVISKVSDNQKYCELTVYEPEWQGGRGLVDAMSGTFSATVIDRVNIDYMEGEVYIANAANCYSYQGMPEILDIQSGSLPDGSGTQYYLGTLTYAPGSEAYWSSVTGDISLSLMGGTLEGSSDSFANCVNVFLRTVERFDLYDAFNIA